MLLIKSKSSSVLNFFSFFYIFLMIFVCLKFFVLQVCHILSLFSTKKKLYYHIWILINFDICYCMHWEGKGTVIFERLDIFRYCPLQYRLVLWVRTDLGNNTVRIVFKSNNRPHWIMLGPNLECRWLNFCVWQMPLWKTFKKNIFIRT